MAKRAYVLAQRNDVAGMNIQVLDLKPNSSQKNSVYDGDGQTFYMNALDTSGTTHMIDNAFESGSRQTTMAVFYEATADDTTGGGNDVLATQHASLGLAAYLRERVHPGGVALATAGRMTLAHANDQVAGVMALVKSGGDLTVAGINAVLSNVALGGVASTDLGGAAALSKSFGTVEDILRILSGEIYRSSMYCIICDAADQFQSLTERGVLVVAQVSTTTGKTFVSQGSFLSNLENGYENTPMLAVTGDMSASIGGGYLYKMEAGMTFKNPAFAYSAADVTPFKPRAYDVGGVAIPATGLMGTIRVYDHEGTNML